MSSKSQVLGMVKRVNEDLKSNKIELSPYGNGRWAVDLYTHKEDILPERTLFAGTWVELSDYFKGMLEGKYLK